MNVAGIIDQHIQLALENRSVLSAPIDRAGRLIGAALKSGKKVMTCGNGGSACEAEHLASELTGRFQNERRPLAGISLASQGTLTAIANDYSFKEVFARQVEALGRKGDVLVCYTTSGNSENILRAIPMAHYVGARVVLVSGRDGGMAAPRLAPEDVEVRVGTDSTARIQELHNLTTHCLCEVVDEVVK